MEIMQTRQSKVMAETSSFLKRRFGTLGITIVTIAFLFWGYIDIVKKDITLLEIIISGGMSVFVAYAIDTLLRQQGILDGSLDPKVIESETSHMKAVETSIPYFIYADAWAENENDMALKVARTHILAYQGLRYDDFFEKDGSIKNVKIEKPSSDEPSYIKKRYRNQIRALTRASKFRITPLTLTKLTSETTTSLDQNYMGREKAEYVSQKAKVVALCKVLGFGVFGLIGFDLIRDPSWVSLYYGLIQVSIFLLMGLISYFLSYTYMTGEYSNGLRKKTLFLGRLVSYGKKREVSENGSNV